MKGFAGKELGMRRIITIGREFGSGGRELGRRIAEKLQIAYYDQEIIKEIAKRTEQSEEYIRRIEETRPTVSYPVQIGRSFAMVTDTMFYPDLSIYTKQHEVLRELAGRSDCVIVGRCADYILRERKPVRIFVYADMPSKIRRCLERRPVGENLSEEQMKKKIVMIDRKRSKYYSFVSEQKWGLQKNYDLLVNTSDADMEKLASSLSGYLEAWFE
jgi:cytidylate kinase